MLTSRALSIAKLFHARSDPKIKTLSNDQCLSPISRSSSYVRDLQRRISNRHFWGLFPPVDACSTFISTTYDGYCHPCWIMHSHIISSWIPSHQLSIRKSFAKQRLEIMYSTKYAHVPAAKTPRHQRYRFCSCSCACYAVQHAYWVGCELLASCH